MNNVEEFYDRKRLLRTVEDLMVNRPIFYVHNEIKELRIEFNNDLNGALTVDQRQMMLEIIKDELKELEPGIKGAIIIKLKENKEYSRKKIIEDLNLIEKEKKE